MKKDKIKVLVVDDSALMRNLIGRIIDEAPDLEVAGKAMNGQFALQKIPKLDPDVIVLDLEMPEMNGIEFLKEKKKQKIDAPVIILSSIAQKGAQVTIEALALGASDFIMKPSGAISEDIGKVRDNLVKLIRGLGYQYKKDHDSEAGYTPEVITEKTNRTPKSIPEPSDGHSSALPLPVLKDKFDAEHPDPHGPIDVIAIGISTGGPNALRTVFANMEPDLGVPILVVQHMPPGFTKEFAKSLDKICPYSVKEAEEGDILKKNRVLICPGNVHMVIEKKALAGVVHLSDSVPVNSHRPSVDVLFDSLAETYRDRVLAVIMTGMGKDGARAIGSILKKGGITVGQDEETSIVFGMPRVAWELGHLQYQIPLDRIAETITDISRTYNS